MKPLARRLLLFVIVSTLGPVLHAHPGHDGGHELTWDLGHLAAHPGATLLCAATLAASAYVAYRFARWVRETPERE